MFATRRHCDEREAASCRDQRCDSCCYRVAGCPELGKPSNAAQELADRWSNSSADFGSVICAGSAQNIARSPDLDKVLYTACNSADCLAA